MTSELFSADEPIRLATEADGAALADLIHFASHGFAFEFWRDGAGDGADDAAIWAYGRARQAARAAENEIYVVDEGEGPVAGLIGYAIGGEAEPIGPDFPPTVAPLQRLENQALNTWYINVLAAYPAQRGRGYGTRLLRLAEMLARREGLTATSLIAEDVNAGAIALYERAGYVETAREAIVRGRWRTDGREWILYTKPLEAA